MDPQTLQNYIALAGAIINAGGTLVGTLKGVLASIRPDHGLTDDQINKIEAAGVADSERRRAEREAMGRSDG